MTSDHLSTIKTTLENAESRILADWLSALQTAASSSRRLGQAELLKQCQNFLATFTIALSHGGKQIKDPPFDKLRDLLTTISSSRAAQGFSPGETATFVFSLKQPFMAAIRAAHPRHGRS